LGIDINSPVCARAVKEKARRRVLKSVFIGLNINK